MIEVSLLGTGSPIVDPDRAGPSTLVRCGSHLFLVDCGRGALLRAAAVGVGAADLTALLLTHLHSDHITDLNDVITTRWITTLRSTPLPIIGPQGTAQVVYATLATLGPDIRYRMVHHPDITEPPAPDVREHTEGLVWNSDGVRILVAPTDHRPAEPTIAFRIGYEKASVVLAGDSVPYGALDGLAAGADALVHSAIRKDLIDLLPQQRLKDILDYHSSVEQAAQTAAKAGVDTLVLTHYVPPIARGQEEEWRQRAASVFDGRIELGNDLHRVEINTPM